jgi:HEPN domain-containing protein
MKGRFFMQSKEIVKEWIKKAAHDLDGVTDIINGSGHPDVAGVLLQQAVEKYLKGYLIGKGWKLEKTHDLKKLLDKAVKYNPAFNEYYDLLDILTGYYFEEKYPIGETEVTLEDIKGNLKSARKLIAFIKKELKK